MNKIPIWLLPIIVFVFVILKYSHNVPWFDDIDAFVDSILIYNQSSTFSQTFSEVFRPNNEHRSITLKTLNFVLFELNGKVNFKYLQWIPNLFTLGVFIIFYQILPKSSSKNWILLSIGLILFTPQYFHTSTWAITGLQHHTSIFLGILSLFFITRKSLNINVLGVFFLVLTSFSMSNGLFFWPAAVFGMLITQRYKWAIFLTVLMVICYKLYFLHFNSYPLSASVEYFLSHPIESFFAFFIHMGGLLDFFNIENKILRYLPAFALGCLEFFIFFYFLYKTKLKNISNNKSFIYSSLAFFFINTFIIAIFRTRFGFDVITISNYRLYPAVLACLIIILTEYKATYVALAFWLLSFVVYLPQMHQRTRDMLTRAYNQQHAGIGLAGWQGTNLQKYIDSCMSAVVQKHIYAYPDQSFLDTENAQISTKKLPVKTFISNVSGFVQNDSLANKFWDKNGYFAILSNEQFRYVISEKRIWKNSLKRGFEFQIPEKHFPKGNYKVQILETDGVSSTIFETGEVVTINF